MPRACRRARRGLLLALAVVFLTPLSTLGAQGDAAPAGGDALWPRLAAQSQAQGRFRQELFDESGALMERSAGRYAVMKPGYFRWEIDDPDRQEIVVADGVLWHYDIDLATVSRRDVDEDGAFTALDLLARDTQDLAARFQVERLGDERFRLRPQFAGATFSAVDVTWEGEAIVAMVVHQRGGQRLSLALEPDMDAPPLDPSAFDFQVPEGIDLQAEAGF